MSGSACGPRCGWCGRCTAEWERPPDQPTYNFCDYCGRDANIGAVTVGGFGHFCSQRCADLLKADAEERKRA